MSAKQLKIRILEDNLFYNELLTRQIERYTQTIEIQGPLSFQVRSYHEVQAFMADLDPDTTLLFIDYYLDHGKNAQEVVDRVDHICSDCTVVIISENRRSYVIEEMLKRKVNFFIHKDENALSAVCWFIDNYLQKQFKK